MAIADRLAAAVAACLLAVASQAAAQSMDPPAVISPLKLDPDRNGVNLTTGRIRVDVPTLGIPAAPRLRFDLVQNAAPYMRGTLGSDELRTGSFSVHTDGLTSESFACSDFDCGSSLTETGSKFTMLGLGKTGRYERGGSDETYYFTLNSVYSTTAGITTTQAYASSVAYPDGEAITYTYDSLLYNGATYYRPTKIATNAGYFITVDYQSNTFGTNEWSIPFHAILYAASAPTVPLQSLTYNSTTGAVTDIGGRTWIIGVTNQLGQNVETPAATVQLPTEASNSLTVSRSGTLPLVGSVIRDGVTWAYAYTNPVFKPRGNYGDYTYNKVTVTGPNGYSMAYDISGGTCTVCVNLIAKSTDALNRQTNYEYDFATRLTKITLPEGNYTQIDYDSIGNIIKKTSVAKAGSGLANIIESALYPDPATCTHVLCFRPNSYTDARSQVTSYAWNTAGQMTKELAPADANGAQRLTLITYAASPAGISRKTLVQVCASSSTNIATAVCSGNALSHTEYTYVGDTMLPLNVTVKDEATGVTETTTYTYDNAGRVLSVQGPQNGVSGTKYFRYDVYGRKVWEIGAADASNLRVAKRFTYRDSDDKVTKVETGTVTCPTNCNTDPLTLTLLEQTDTTYDSRRYPIREATSSGGTNYRVTDRSFLDRGLADCTTVRMNLAALQTPTSTSACNVPAVLPNPDRITRNSYDNAGQLLKIQKAWGVTTANGFPATLQQDYVTYAYTPNGKQQFITDANGNKAQYTWDGFDRLSKWNFPSPTTPGIVSTTDYELYTYDAAGNRLSLRRRDGRTLTFTYDNLNRMLSKLIPDGCPPIQPPGTGCPAASATRDVFYGYDLMGRQLTAKFDSASGADGVTNSYDGFGNLKISSTAMAGFTKSICSSSLPCLYDLDNNRTQVTLDGPAFSYAYDARDRLTGVSSGVLPGTLRVGFTYNADDTLQQRADTGSDGGTATYGYDAIGRLATQAEAFPSFSSKNVSWNLSPAASPINPASQITQETRDNDAYAYAVANTSKAYQVNGLNQYTAVAGTAQTYDAAGNLTGDGTNSYVYDGENRLVSATAAGVTATLTYDPLGRLWRVQKGASDTRFLYDGDAMVAEYDGTGALTNRYVHGSNAAADDPLIWYATGGTVKRYLHADHLGSIVAATNPSAAPSINTYDEYGVLGASNVGRFQYTGQIWLSELGLYHYKARLYSPTLGRFLQTDPIGYQDAINLYEYAATDPVNAFDSSGEVVQYSRKGNDIYIHWNIAYYGASNTLPNRAKFTNGIIQYWGGQHGKYNVHASVTQWTYKPGTQPTTADIIRHPDLNFVEIPAYTQRAFTSGDRFGTWGANRTGWVAAHETGHLSHLPDEYDAGGPYPGYEHDIMGAQGQPLTERTIENLITVEEGAPPQTKKQSHEPQKPSSAPVNGCPANSAQPLTCGGGLDGIWL